MLVCSDRDQIRMTTKCPGIMREMIRDMIEVAEVDRKWSDEDRIEFAGTLYRYSPSRTLMTALAKRLRSEKN